MRRSCVAASALVSLAASAASPPALWMEYQLANSSDDRYRVNVNSLRRDGDIGFVTDDVVFAEPQDLSDGRTFSIKGEHLMIGCDDHNFALVRATIGGGNLAEPIYLAPRAPAVTRVQPNSYVAKLAVLACDPPPLESQGWVSIEPGLQVLPTPSRYAPPETTRVWTRTGKYGRSGQLAGREYSLERWDLYCSKDMTGAGSEVHSAHLAVSYQRLLAIAGEDDLGEATSQGSDTTAALSDKARALLWVRFCGEGI